MGVNIYQIGGITTTTIFAVTIINGYICNTNFCILLRDNLMRLSLRPVTKVK